MQWSKIWYQSNRRVPNDPLRRPVRLRPNLRHFVVASQQPVLRRWCKSRHRARLAWRSSLRPRNCRVPARRLPWTAPISPETLFNRREDSNWNLIMAEIVLNKTNKTFHYPKWRLWRGTLRTFCVCWWWISWGCSCTSHGRVPTVSHPFWLHKKNFKRKLNKSSYLFCVYE